MAASVYSPIEKVTTAAVGNYDECFNPFIFDEIPAKAHCLDIGCWTGNLGFALVGKKNCVVDGVDFNSKALEVAQKRGYRQTFEINFNNTDWSCQNITERYDVIICADVLEHLINPLQVLKQLATLLKPDGTILISLPNVAFIQIRLQLLLGMFDYNPVGGIMDSTHLRFYTINSFCREIKENFKLLQVYGYALVRPRYFFLKLLAYLRPTLFAPQFIVKLSPN